MCAADLASIQPKSLWRAVLFGALAHAIAGGAVVTCAIALAIVSYFGLFALAVVTDSAVGSPLALLAMIAVAFALAVAVVLLFLLPVTIAAQLLCGRLLRWPRAAQIPVTMVLSLAAVPLVAGVASRLWPVEQSTALFIGTGGWGLLLAPLALYWWILQAPAALVWVVQRVRRGVRA